MSMLETLLDPQRRHKAAEVQVRLKEVMGHRVARDAAQRNYLYGFAREQMALEQLERLGNANADQSLYEQLAEGLALQGNFEAAAAIAPEGPRKDAYKAKANAVANVGEQQCGCPASHQVNGQEQSTQLAASKVFTGKVSIQFTRCLECGAVSAYA